MSQVSKIEFEDSDSGESTDANTVAGACAGLRRSAFRAVNRLAGVRPHGLSNAIRRQLRDLCRRLNASDAHLFRVKVDKTGSGFLGLRYHSELTATNGDLKTLQRFQFQLLPETVRDCLLSAQIAVLRGQSKSGGTMLTGLLKQMHCESYLLVPISVAGELRGILGIARRDSNDIRDHAEYLELLKLNGSILLNHVIRIRREKRRNRKLRKWREIAHHACDFAFSVDHRDTIISTTPFGMVDKTPRIDGLRLKDVVEVGLYDGLRKEIKIAVETKTVRSFVFQLKLGHEGPRWYLARIEPSRNNGNIAATLYLTDNHRDKVLQQVNRELTEKLIKSSRLSLLGLMSTEFGHQLNQPLQAILNYCNTMQRRIRKGTDTPENLTRSLNSIEKSVVHSGEIIRRIRDFVQFRTMHIDDATVGDALDQAMLMVRPTATARNAEIILPTEHADVGVAIDLTQTTHVFVNLFINALEACAKDRGITPRIETSIEVMPVQNRVIVSIKDNGPGLPPNDPSKVFRRFYSSKAEGLGMGLAISREVCESQGGFLSAENNADGPGCTFTMTLPMAVDPGTETAEIPVVPPQPLPAD